jgi:hypothetical protein
VPQSDGYRNTDPVTSSHGSRAAARAVAITFANIETIDADAIAADRHRL